MNRLIVGASIAIVASVMSVHVRADYWITWTGDDLYTLCQGIEIQTKKPDISARGRCLGYIAGVMDLWGKLRAFEAVKQGPFDLDFCLPQGGVRAGATASAVVDYLGGFEASMRAADSGAAFVIPALSKAFPCSR